MSNLNPIKVDQPQVSTDFEIPAGNINDQITLTVKIDLTTDDWSYVISCIVYLNGNDIYPAGNPEPSLLKLGTGAELNGKPLSVQSKIALIYAPGGATGNPPVYKYTISIDAGATNLGSFEADSGVNNPTRFRSLTLFKQL